jgi:hypothetical protein
MIQDTADTTAQSAPLRALVYGETGSGKTFSLQTLPATMLPALIFDFDQNSEALRGRFQPGELFLAGFDDYTVDARGATKPSAYSAARTMLTDLLANKLPFTPKTIIIDSVTRLYSNIMDYGMDKSSRKEEDAPQLQDYGAAAALMLRFTRVCLQTQCNVIFLAHEKAYANEVTGIEKGVPALTGQLGDTIPRFFQEILHAKASGGGANRKYLWETQPTGKFVARTCRPHFDAAIPQDWKIYA